MSDDRARRPALARRARLRWDEARGQHVVVVPEGVLMLTEEGAEILALVDGRRPLGEIADALCAAHPDAPRDVIEADLRDYLGRLVERGYVTLDGP